MKSSQHLLLVELKPSPSAEWKVSGPGWLFLRVDAGTVYWLCRPQARELGAGDVFVVCPGRSGLLRASRLGEVMLRYFHFRPELLGGFLTSSERQFFEFEAARSDRVLRLVPSAHSFAQQFARVVDAISGKSAFVQRCELLRLMAVFFGDDVEQYQTATLPSSVTSHRFKRFIEEMPEAEFVNRSPQELARYCGYSSRHFGRLFRQYFHTNIRAKQTELRLMKARQLLSDTDAKIVHVALESGYRHLGLFNTAFKKRFGMTPSEWRKRNAKPRRRKNIRGLSLLVILAALLWPVLSPAICAEEQNPAATSPAGSKAVSAPTTNSQPATATQTNAPTFEVRGYEVTGNTLFAYDDLLPIFSKYVGPAVTFNTIRTALAEFQSALRDRGFVTVSVTLPEQKLTNGIVKVRVVQGRLADINIVNNRYFSSNNIMRALPSLRPGILLNSLVFQQDLDHANVNRDRQLYPVIGPGPDPGTTALTLKVKDRLPLHGKLELNNFSTPNTPDLRLNLAGQYNNLWQREHQIGVQYSFTPEELKEDNSAFYDRPLIANYSAFYRAPLSFVGASDPTPTLGISDFGFDEATRRFRPPPPRDVPEMLIYASRSVSDTGSQLVSETLTPRVIPPEGALQVSDKLFNQTLTTTENLGLRFLDPLPPLGEIRSTFSIGPDFKSYRAQSLQERIFQATIFVPEFGSTGPPFVMFESPPTRSTRGVFNSVSYLPLSVGWDASRMDKHGVTSFNVNYSVNFSGLLDGKEHFQDVAGSPRADGNYHIIVSGMTREQKIYGDWGLRFRIDGQWANEPLISNEQFALGGNAGVRGYREGQEYGDTGWRFTVEPHTPSFKLGMVNKSPMFARGIAFVDYGRRYLLDPGAREYSTTLFGTGFGGNATIGQWLEAKLIFGLPIYDVPGVTAFKPHVTFSLSFQF